MEPSSPIFAIPKKYFPLGATPIIFWSSSTFPTKASIVTLKSVDSLINDEQSGSLSPLSHFATVCLDTLILSLNASCVIPFLFLRNIMFSPTIEKLYHKDEEINNINLLQGYLHK